MIYADLCHRFDTFHLPFGQKLDLWGLRPRPAFRFPTDFGPMSGRCPLPSPVPVVLCFCRSTSRMRTFSSWPSSNPPFHDVRLRPLRSATARAPGPVPFGSRSAWREVRHRTANHPERIDAKKVGNWILYGFPTFNDFFDASPKRRTKKCTIQSPYTTGMVLA